MWQTFTYRSFDYEWKLYFFINRKNKHSESIAEAIYMYVPYWPQQILKLQNTSKNRLKDTKVKPVLYYVNTNSYTKFEVNILKDGKKTEF